MQCTCHTRLLLTTSRVMEPMRCKRAGKYNASYSRPCHCTPFHAQAPYGLRVGPRLLDSRASCVNRNSNTSCSFHNIPAWLPIFSGRVTYLRMRVIAIRRREHACLAGTSLAVDVCIASMHGSRFTYRQSLFAVYVDFRAVDVFSHLVINHSRQCAMYHASCIISNLAQLAMTRG
jgi:hypothetical protein